MTIVCVHVRHANSEYALNKLCVMPIEWIYYQECARAR